MASESTSGEKTEEGSEKKTREAIERGNVPFSREASVFLSLGAMLAISALMLRNSVPALADALSRIFANPTRDPFATTADTLAIFQFTADASTRFLMPIFFILMMAGLVAGFAQGVPHLVARAHHAEMVEAVAGVGAQTIARTRRPGRVRQEPVQAGDHLRRPARWCCAAKATRRSRPCSWSRRRSAAWCSA